MADEIKTCGDLDERLAPYVDGEAAADTRRAVDAHLTKCPPCRRNADAEAAMREVVAQRRDELKASAPASLRERCERAASSAQLPASGSGLPPSRSLVRRWAPLSLAATLLLAVAGAFLFGLNNRVEALASSLVLDHIKCFATPGNASADALARASERWQTTHGWAISVPPSDASAELHLVNVRRCLTTDGGAAHILYTWRGAPLSVYVLRENAGRDSALDRFGHEGAIWCANGRTYAVIADGHPPDLPHIVDYMKARVR